MQRRKSEIKKVSSENFTEYYPHLNQWKSRVTKVILYNLDGTTSEMKLIFPILSFWSEPQEESQYYLRLLVYQWTESWLNISKFEVHLGSIDHNDVEHYSIKYEPEKIPLNMVWKSSDRSEGSWVNRDNIKPHPELLIDRTNYKYLRPYDVDSEVAPVWKFEDLLQLAFDISLCDAEASEFQEEIKKAKEQEAKGKDLQKMIFFPCYIRGCLRSEIINQ
jgi:hypothetical protein